MTKFSAVTSAVVALLGAGTPVSQNIWRARGLDGAVAEQYKDAVNVYLVPGQSEQGAIFGAPVDWESKLVVEIYARTTTTSADLAIDPLMAEVYARIAADSTLGSLIEEIETPFIDFQSSAELQRAAYVEMVFKVRIRTKNFNLE